MDPFSARAKHGAEFHIQTKWVKFLEGKGWLVQRMIGNQYISGIPDLFIAHKQYGQKFVDIKVYGRYSFTKAQKIVWPLWESFNIGIWIIGAKDSKSCTKEHMLAEFPKLMQPPNWRDYWKPQWDEKPDIDKLLEDVDNADSKLPE